MDKILLDVRSGDSNSISTGLGLRYVLGHTEGINRVYRDLYESDVDGDLLYISMGDGKISKSGVSESVNMVTYKVGEEGGRYFYNFRDRVEIVTLRDSLDNVVNDYTFSYGTLLDSGVELGESDIKWSDLGFYVTRNESSRGRFKWGGDRWKLLKGGEVENLGRFLEEVNLGFSGFIRIGVNPSESSDKYEIGSNDFPIVLESNLESHIFNVNEIGIIGDGSGKVRWNGSKVEYEGMDVYYFGTEFGLTDGLVLGDYISPIPLSKEIVLFRDGRKGYLEYLSVSTELDLENLNVGVGQVGVCLSSGKIKRGVGISNIYYEGVILGISKIFESQNIVGNSLPFKELGNKFSSGISYVPDGNGLVPSGVNPSGVRADGSGLVWKLEGILSSYVRIKGVRIYPLDLVDEFPSKLRNDRVYLRSSDYQIAYSYVIGYYGNLYGMDFIQAFFPVVDREGNITSGLVLGLTSNDVTGYTNIDESVGDISDLSIFNFIDFTPRMDFLGYGNNKFFKVGDNLLVENEDILYRFDDSKIEWIENVTKGGRINQPLSEIFLDQGIKSNSVTLELKQETSEGVFETENLVLDESFDVPLDGLKGTARLITKLSGEKQRGVNGVLNNGVLTLPNHNLNVGDWVKFKDNFYRKISQVNGEDLTLSSVEDLDNVKSWIGYEGYVSEPNFTLLSGECFTTITATDSPSIIIYKVYSDLNLFLNSHDVKSKLYVRNSDNLILPILILVPSVVENLKLDISDSHVSSNSYEILVDGNVYTDGNGFTLDINTGLITFDNAIGNEQIIYRPLPQLNNNQAEVSLDGNTILSPIVIEDYLEHLQDFNFEASTSKISFTQPLKANVGIDVSYVPVLDDGLGDRVIETIGFTVNKELCTRLDNRIYTFNVENSVIFENTSISVMVNSEILGYAGSLKATLVDNQTISIPFDVPVEDDVRITYVIKQSKGGNQTVSLSSPIYDPIIQIPEKANQIIIPRDLTSILSNGSILKFNNHCFAVNNISYDGTNSTVNLTSHARYFVQGKIELLVGGNDLFITLNQNNGFTLISSNPRGNQFFIKGDFRSSFKTGVVFVVSGEIHIVDKVDIIDGVTVINVLGFSLGVASTEILISVRPINIEGNTDLISNTMFLKDKPFTLIKYQNNIGEELSESVDFTVDSDSGFISLINNHKIEPNIFYYLFHTSVTMIQPKIMTGNRISYPSYSSTYNKTKAPIEYKDQKLFSKCVIETPDTFYVREVLESEYASELSSELASRISATSNRGNGARPKLVGNKNGKSFLFFDLLAEDVVARNRIKLYDGVVYPIDHLISTMTGDVVGDTS